MAKPKQQPQKQQLKLPGRKPTHRLYCVHGDGQEASWTPIGAAWPHSDNNGFSIECEAVPLKGRLVLRFITERSAANDGGQQ